MKAKSKTEIKIGIGILTLLLLSLPASLWIFEVYHAGRVYPGVSVWETDVSGMRPEDAAAHIAASLDIGNIPITLQGPDRSWVARMADLGVSINSWATMALAYNAGRSDSSSSSWAKRTVEHLLLMIRGENFAPVVIYDEQMSRLYLETLAQQVDLPAADATIVFDGLTPVIEPAHNGQRLDVEATLKGIRTAVRQLTPATVPLIVHTVPPAVADAEQARAKIQAWLDGPLTLMLKDPREGDPGPWTITPEELAAMIVLQPEDGVLHASMDESALAFYLEGLVDVIAIEPVDARFHFDEASQRLTPIQPSVEGRAMDVSASVERILMALEEGNRYVPLVVRSVPPRYPDTATAEELGITTLVAEGDSYFIDSPSARDHNIRLAAPKFDGLIIPPGETFSFNEYLGPVTEEAGYDKSYITAGEQLAIDIGGGICQVSTTAFRAAFWGGYPITERWYHTYRVGYYELMGAGVGMDATVYSPHVDFKFVNDRPYPLLIETEIVEGAHRLIFRFYSTDDGRRVEKEGPVVSDETTPGPPIYQLDESLPPGTVIRWQSAVNGLTATIRRRVYDADGNLLYDDLFVSKYEPRRAAYHYGVGYEPPVGDEDTEGG